MRKICELSRKIVNNLIIIKPRVNQAYDKLRVNLEEIYLEIFKNRVNREFFFNRTLII